MRHQIKGRKFHRDMSARKALFKSLSISVIEHELIKTTLPKGKDLRSVVEPLITLAKVDTVANRRLAFARLGNDVAVKKLFEVLGPRFKERQGGYLRLLKCGFRKGDAAPMCYVEVLDRPEAMVEAEVPVAPKAAKAAPTAKAAKAEAKPSKPAAKKETAATAEAKPAAKEKATEAIAKSESKATEKKAAAPKAAKPKAEPKAKKEEK